MLAALLELLLDLFPVVGDLLFFWVDWGDDEDLKNTGRRQDVM
ncbi:MAG TPA: hypothetical protein VLA96_02140 [Terriglobales bacterium]|nr:hypothetical protein [Terriglobales bacterium]